MSDTRNTSTDNKYEEAAKKMTQTTTYRLAAALILDKSFPSKEGLPPVLPPAFNNFGHQLLLDYGLLLKIIWQVVTDIQQVVKRLAFTATLLRALAIVIVAVVFTRSCYALIIGRSFFDRNTFWLVIVDAAIGVIAYIMVRKQHKNLDDQIAKIRASAIDELLKETWDLRSNATVNDVIDKRLEGLTGDGIIRTEKIPVLIITDSRRPFPGYGQLLFDNLFVCPPKKTENTSAATKYSNLSIKELKEKVDSATKDFIVMNTIRHANIGHVAVIHGKSLSINNKWLDADQKIPKLWTSANELNDNNKNQSREESLRVYSAIQILFPEYETVATFFVRLFSAENSAACHISVTTVGPINFDVNTFRRRLQKYQLGKKQKQLETSGYQQSAKQRNTLLHSIRLLRFALGTTQNVGEFQTERNFQEIVNLNYSLVSGKNESKNRLVTPMGGDALG